MGATVASETVAPLPVTSHEIHSQASQCIEGDVCQCPYLCVLISVFVSVSVSAVSACVRAWGSSCECAYRSIAMLSVNNQSIVVVCLAGTVPNHFARSP